MINNKKHGAQLKTAATMIGSLIHRALCRILIRYGQTIEKSDPQKLRSSEETGFALLMILIDLTNQYSKKPYVELKNNCLSNFKAAQPNC